MRPWLFVAGVLTLAAAALSCTDDHPATFPSALRIEAVIPPAGATHVPVDTAVEIRVDGDPRGRGIPDSVFTVNGLPMRVESVREDALVIRPVALLPYNRVCRVRVSAEGWNAAGGCLEADTSWSFTTDPGPPGVTWSRKTSGTGADLTAVAATGSGYVAVGRDGTVLESENGLAWHPDSFDPPQADLAGVFSLSNLFLVTTAGELYASSPGGAWEPWDPGVTGFQARALAETGPPAASALVVAGTDSDETGVVVRWDGAAAQVFSWESVGPLADVIWSSYYARCFAVGRSGEILHSPDGVQWMEAPPLAPGSFSGGEAVAVRSGYNGGSALVVAVGNGIVCSEDGHSQWSVCASPAAVLHDVVWTGERFVAVGEGGLILVSLDGRDWSAVESGTTVSLHGVSTSGATVVAVGDGGTILRSPADPPEPGGVVE